MTDEAMGIGCLDYCSVTTSFQSIKFIHVTSRKCAEKDLLGDAEMRGSMCSRDFVNSENTTWFIGNWLTQQES